MAYTSPRTWVAGEIPTADIFNTHIRDNLIALKDPPTGVVSNFATTPQTTSTSFVSTGLVFGITTYGGRVLLAFDGIGYNSGAGWSGSLTWSIDGVLLESGAFSFSPVIPAAGGSATAVCLYLTPVLAAGSHTITLLFKANTGGTFSIFSYHAWVREVS